MKEHKNWVWVMFYIAFYLLLIPLLFGGIIQFFALCMRNGFIGFRNWTIIGLSADTIVFFATVKWAYGVNAPFVNSYWNPLFKRNTRHPHERLILTGPGAVIKPFWWMFDSTTRHDREISIDNICGFFETLLKDNLNLLIEGAQISFRLPISHGAKLRSIAKGMDKIEREIIKQLKPAVIQAIATVISRYEPIHILQNQADITREIKDELNSTFNLLDQYGIEIYLFSLGDIGFSKTYNNSREETAKSKLDAEAAQAWIEKSKGADGKPTMTFSQASKLVMMGKEGVKGNIHLFDGIPESAGAGAGAFLAGMVSGNEKKGEKS